MIVYSHKKYIYIILPRPRRCLFYKTFLPFSLRFFFITFFLGLYTKNNCALISLELILVSIAFIFEHFDVCNTSFHMHNVKIESEKRSCVDVDRCVCVWSNNNKKSSRQPIHSTHWRNIGNNNNDHLGVCLFGLGPKLPFCQGCARVCLSNGFRLCLCMSEIIAMRVLWFNCFETWEMEQEREREREIKNSLILQNPPPYP